MGRTIKLVAVVALMLALTATVALAANLAGDGLPNIIDGSAGNDTINGRGGGDRLSGFGGLDTIIGGGGDDMILGGGGADNLQGGNGADRILGGGGDDTIYPSGDAPVDPADYVDCGPGFDTVVRPDSAPANDWLVNCEAIF